MAQNSCERIVEDTVKDSSHRRIKEGMTHSYDYSDNARVGVFWSTDTNALYTGEPTNGSESRIAMCCSYCWAGSY